MMTKQINEIRFIDRRYYRGSYIYLYVVKDKYHKIQVDKPLKKKKQRVLVLRQDKPLKYFTNFKIIKEFKTFKEAKEYLINY
tara:strand:- start:340 stop:585 length:246 start_codon:yes stop_codon:yes gene_type:complete